MEEMILKELAANTKVLEQIKREFSKGILKLGKVSE